MRYGLRVWAWVLCMGALPCAAQLPIDINVEHATFKYDDAESIVEIYLGIGASSLVYVPQSTDYLAQLPIGFSLLRATDVALEGTPEDTVWQHATTLEFIVKDTLEVQEGMYYVRQVRTSAPPGEYELRVSVTAGSGEKVEARRDLIVPAYEVADGCAISDITLATSITQSADRSDPFFKNGLMIMPNTNHLFGEGMDRLWYYAEAYNTDCAASDKGTYTLLAFISRANASMPVQELQKRSSRQARPVDVLVGSFPLGSLPSGSYHLRLVLLNEANEAEREQSRKFFVFNPSVSVELPESVVAETFETSEYAIMSPEELEKGIEHIRIIATETERQRLNRIRDPDARRRFLMEFWQVRDPDPNTAVNEYREEFYALLEYADERYSTGNEEGWRSDRGHTLLKYGQPSTIEPRMYEAGLRPHEIWQYNTIAGEGQAFFVFADLDGYGTFELIHSTVAGERKMADWQAELHDTRF